MPCTDTYAWRRGKVLQEQEKTTAREEMTMSREVIKTVFLNKLERMLIEEAFLFWLKGIDLVGEDEDTIARLKEKATKLLDKIKVKADQETLRS